MKLAMKEDNINMITTRDLCWLAKPVQLSGISTYYILHSEGSVFTDTIEREMPELFQHVQRSENPKASIIFTIVKGNKLGKEGYRIEEKENGYEVISHFGQGLLYGMYALHRLLQVGEEKKFPFQSIPDQAIRMINHWDNFDGSIERGYAGDSIYYDQNAFRGDIDLMRQYARLLASIGLNAVSINNVNVHKLETFFIEGASLNGIKKIADVFSEYGISTFLAINYAAPITVGHLTTADPLSLDVVAWWDKVVTGIYNVIPNFAGFIVKADSEGEPGPFTYGRNHDEGANMLAKAVKPYGGLIIWRCFVYRRFHDWRDRSLDRAKEAYDIFMGIDGNFEDNVILQIKNGPIDFQIREPNSPLFGAIRKTNHILEFQITQEYTGHQKDVCYLVPMWKETLDFDTIHGGKSIIKHLLKENSPNSNHSGIAAVVNVGMDFNWTGHKLAQANLYGYGRLIWDNQLSSREISSEWIRLSFEMPEKEEEKIQSILLTSRDVYESYTCPLSVGFMCKPALHYGVDIDGYEYDKWGTYHYADRNGVGRDRTVATGSAYSKQYSKERFQEYENLSTCPDEFLLFFHHVPYTHVLHSGQTVIQHIYDTHFDGVKKVEEYQAVWKTLKDVIDEESYLNVKERLKKQYENVVEWRDQINTYFYRKSGIMDEKGRNIAQ